MITDGKGNTYVYDEENRLIEADTPNTTITKVISVYDGLSRRVEKRTYDSSGTLLATTRYLYDGLLPIAEYDASNNVTKTYTRGLDLSGTPQGAGGIGGLLAVTDSTGSYSYFTDGNGNITDLTNAYGTVVSHSEYDPFGNVVATTGTYQQSYGWSSKENDGNGFTYYLYRFYNPSLGRWVNRDPIGIKGGLNTYILVGNNSQNKTDIRGLCGYFMLRIPGDKFTVPDPENQNGTSMQDHMIDAYGFEVTFVDQGCCKGGTIKLVPTIKEEGTSKPKIDASKDQAAENRTTPEGTGLPDATKKNPAPSNNTANPDGSINHSYDDSPGAASMYAEFFDRHYTIEVCAYCSMSGVCLKSGATTQIENPIGCVSFDVDVPNTAVYPPTITTPNYPAAGPVKYFPPLPPSKEFQKAADDYNKQGGVDAPH